MRVRTPIVAGQFYPEDAEACLSACQQHIEALSSDLTLPQQLFGGVVPHAGWVFSGDCVGLFFRILQSLRHEVDTFVVFGATHRYAGQSPVVGVESAWSTPCGSILVDQDLRQVGGETGLWVQDANAHAGEHSIEVILPFIKYCYPQARLLPILTPPLSSALTCGAELSRLLTSESTVLLASTDLTHYGPGYGFTPMGVGTEGWTWARDHNDVAFLDCVTRLDGAAVLRQAQDNGNACGAGAVAAAVSCARSWGALSGTVVAHTTSNEVLLNKTGRCGSDSVGYATVVF